MFIENAGLGTQSCWKLMMFFSAGILANEIQNIMTTNACNEDTLS
jgi:hypothetical protein